MDSDTNHNEHSLADQLFAGIGSVPCEPPKAILGGRMDSQPLCAHDFVANLLLCHARRRLVQRQSDGLDRERLVVSQLAKECALLFNSDKPMPRIGRRRMH